MRAISINETQHVQGGEVGATGMGDNYHYAGYTDQQATQCANTVMAWGGMGGAIGGLFGGIGGLVGMLVGGAAGARRSESCNLNYYRY